MLNIQRSTAIFYHTLNYKDLYNNMFKTEIHVMQEGHIHINVVMEYI